MSPSPGGVPDSGYYHQQGGSGLADEHLPDNGAGFGTHAECRLYDPGRNFFQGRLHHPANQRGGGQGQGNDGGGGAVGLADQELCQGHNQNQQNQEGNAPGNVDDDIQNPVHRPVGGDAAFVRQGQGDAQGQADDIAEEGGDDCHIAGVPDALGHHFHHGFIQHSFLPPRLPSAAAAGLPWIWERRRPRKPSPLPAPDRRPAPLPGCKPAESPAFRG